MPIWPFTLIIVAAGILLLIQGIAQVFRCVICIRDGAWPPKPQDIEELEKVMIEQHARGEDVAATIAPKQG